MHARIDPVKFDIERNTRKESECTSLVHEFREPGWMCYGTRLPPQRTICKVGSKLDKMMLKARKEAKLRMIMAEYKALGLPPSSWKDMDTVLESDYAKKKPELIEMETFKVSKSFLADKSNFIERIQVPEPKYQYEPDSDDECIPPVEEPKESSTQGWIKRKRQSPSHSHEDDEEQERARGGKSVARSMHMRGERGRQRGRDH